MPVTYHLGMGVQMRYQYLITKDSELPNAYTSGTSKKTAMTHGSLYGARGQHVKVWRCPSGPKMPKDWELFKVWNAPGNGDTEASFSVDDIAVLSESVIINEATVTQKNGKTTVKVTCEIVGEVQLSDGRYIDVHDFVDAEGELRK